MKIFKIISYISALIIFYLSSYIAYGKDFNILMFWDLSSIIFILAGFVFSLVNFKFIEIFSAVKTAISSKSTDINDLAKNKIIIKSLWSKIITMANIGSLIASIILFSYLSDTRKIGPSLAIIGIVYIYSLALKVFVFTPLEVSIDKKIILQNNNLNK